jgi:hypothetical protein
MKGWLVTALALFGGYIIVKHFLFRRAGAGGLSGELSGTQTLSGTQAAQQTGVGDFFVSPIASGVPVFNNAAIANGHGDQVAAALHTNTLATLPGSAVYEPAFGPVTNQDPTNSIYLLG